VFSPYYAWARRRGATPAINHCALNVALYAARGGRWAMTERGAAQVARDATSLSIGPSTMRWSGETLEITVDEICAPIPRRLRGTVRVSPRALYDRAYLLDGAGKHRWTPFAPCAHVEVAFSEPAVHWAGVGYFDSNCGEEPLEAAFRDWTWSRAGSADDAVVLYDVTTRDRCARSLALKFGAAGAQEIDAPPKAALPRSGWRVARVTRADSKSLPRVVKTLEDAPFYSRSLLESRLLGVQRPAIHESLNLDRFDTPWVRFMLPFRMPRITF
jgi:carotenoid 1,2-hydratase